MPRRLHIGGTERVEGWEILNILPDACVDHLGDAKDLSRFQDNTFSDVYASHVLEHLDYKMEIATTLQEWRRVLEPGGRLYISVPDMDILSRLFLSKDTLSVEDRYHVMQFMFGGHDDAYDYHMVGLNEEFLADYLRNSGFVNIGRVPWFGIFKDTSCGKFKDVPISVNMIAMKPV